MPHLAPMHWIMAITMLWLMITMMNSVNWWTHATKFPKIALSSMKTNKSKWQW